MSADALLQEPPGVVEASVTEVPVQNEPVPVMAAGSALTVTGVVVKQPVPSE
jgi:hypothetical protein